MKHLIPLTAIAAVVASGAVSAQTPAYSKPSGYVTQTLSPGFNLLGLTLQKAPAFSGTVTAVSGSNITVSSDLTALLPAGRTYILEVTAGGGASTGVVQDFTSFSGAVVTLPASMTISGLVATNTVAIRVAPTLEEIFGELLQSQSSSATSDVVWIPSGVGQYDRYYLNTPLFGGAKTWKRILTGSEAAAPNTPVVYLDGIFVEVRGPAVPIVMTGQVKTGVVKFSIQQGFNLVGTVYPVGSTLTSSGLSASLTTQSSSATSDIVWIPTSPGNFTRYYYNTPLFGGSPGWRILPADTAVDGATINLPPSIFIEKQSGTSTVTLSPPSSYSNL